MKKIACPNCNTQACDDTSVFCYKCGAQLPANIPEKKNVRDLNFRMKVPKKESIGSRTGSLLPRKPGSIEHIKPIEICARCGTPIIDKNKIFCPGCTAYVRDTSSREETPIRQYSVSQTLDKNPVITPEIYQYTENKTIKEQEPVLIQGTRNPINPKASGWKIITIVAAIAILFFVLMMIVMLMFSFWVSLY